jgi:predicted DNA-binding protein with PD1-like motif
MRSVRDVFKPRAVPTVTALCLFVGLSAIGFASADSPPRRLVDQVPAGQGVPSPLTFSTSFERIVLVRLTYGTDVLEGLEHAVGQERIKSAVILGGIGSLKGYRVHSVSNTEFPSTNVFFAGVGPYDLTAVDGYVIGGRVHAHVTFSNDRQALAGHLEKGTTTFTFVIVTLGVLPDPVDLERLDDKTWR